ncbi:hypothetical protein YC2023_115927 [Brassica napus]
MCGRMYVYATIPGLGHSNMGNRPGSMVGLVVLEGASAPIRSRVRFALATRGFTWAPLALQTTSRNQGPLSGRLKIL